MENFEQIEKYLLGKMSSDESEAFENKLADDLSLRKEKEDLEKMIIGLQSKGLKSKLKDKKIGGSPKVQQKPTGRIFSIHRLAIAASFIGILMCGWFVMKPISDPVEQLYASAFAADPGLPTPMSETTNYNFYDAMVDYKMEKFSTAIEKWEKAKGTIGPDTLNYYLAMAHINQGSLEKAETILQQVPENSAFSDLSKWYTLKIYLDKGELNKAKNLFKNLPNDIHPKYDDIKNHLKSK